MGDAQAAGEQVRRGVHNTGWRGRVVGRVPERRGTLVSGAFGKDLEVLRDDRARGRSALCLGCDVLPGPEAETHVDVLGHSPGRSPCLESRRHRRSSRWVPSLGGGAFAPQQLAAEGKLRAAPSPGA